MVAATNNMLKEDIHQTRQIDRSDLHWALREGWNDFVNLRGDILVIGFVYPVVVLIVAAVALGADLFPLILPITGGLALLGPLLAVGFYELARRREEGSDARWTHFADPFRRTSRGSIIALGVVVALLFLAWVGFAWQIYENTLGLLRPRGLADLVSAVFTTREGWELIIFGNGVGLAFAVVVLTATVASFPMLVDEAADPWLAIKTSVQVTRRNPATIAIWGFYIAAIMAAACVPLFVGLAVAMPVLGYSSWHLYTRMVARTDR